MLWSLIGSSYNSVSLICVIIRITQVIGIKQTKNKFVNFTPDLENRIPRGGLGICVFNKCSGSSYCNHFFEQVQFIKI